jgi:glycosyltransferase involved in cell wall biosynthesis
MKVSIIIPTYKDPVALNLILEALEKQTYKNFEVIIAEDDNSYETKELIDKFTASYTIKHYSHPDQGNRKPVAVNASVAMSEGEYIIMIDGDTIPYSTFIDAHVRLAEPKKALCGRRVNLGDKVSAALRQGVKMVGDIEHAYFEHFKYLQDDNSRHLEQGLYLRPNSWLQNIIAKMDNNTHIVASNFSCFKSDLLEVNGIDESLPYPPSRDDTDLEWRLKAIGVEMKSCKFCANLLHLNHRRNDRADEDAANRQIIAEKQKRNEYRSRSGIVKESM